jgi:hypothetical protein
VWEDVGPFSRLDFIEAATWSSETCVLFQLRHWLGFLGRACGISELGQPHHLHRNCPSPLRIDFSTAHCDI